MRGNFQGRDGTRAHIWVITAAFILIVNVNFEYSVGLEGTAVCFLSYYSCL